MPKLKYIFPILLLLALLVWGVPAILKAMPSRYVARLPEPLQQLGLPQTGAPILPTAVSPHNVAALLQTPTQTLGTVTEPPTPSPLATFTAAARNIPIPTTSPSTPTTTPAPTPWPRPDTTRLTGVQHRFQTWNNCGPATLAMALTYFDLNLTQEETAVILKPNPEDRNVSPHEMAAFVNNETPYAALFRANGNVDLLRTLIAHDIPVIIEIGIEPPGEFRWMGWYGHYLLVVAYDDTQEQFWVYDSWFGTSEEPLQNAHPDGRVLTYADLATYWPHFNRNYIALYTPEQADTVAGIIGPAMDDATMWQEALRRVQNETTRAPENAFNWFNLGTVYNALDRYEDAAAAFDQARTIGLPWRMLWYQFGPYEAYYQTGRYEDVVLLADVTLQDRPYFEESFYYRGLALAAMGNMRGARQNLMQALQFNPHFAPAEVALARLES